MSFLSLEANHRLKENSLIELTKKVNWSSLLGHAKGMRSSIGSEGYNVLSMIKALILQAWHNLSDRELEDALRVRLDFMVITGLVDVPDHSTICRFRCQLIEKGTLPLILESINKDLEAKGLKVEKSKGAIVDATIIQSAGRPRKEIEVCEDRKEEETITTVTETLSKDKDARWIKKGNKSHFGYKSFNVVDQEDGYIEQIHVTPANEAECKQLRGILDKAPKQYASLQADKAYQSKENSDLLKKKKIKNRIMKKAYRNRPLTHWEKTFNKLISKTRYKVEQCFGTLKRRFNFVRASYFSTKKVEAQMTLKAIAFNLLKALNKLSTRELRPFSA